jgi:uncharacterized protein (DUF2235 family)
MSKQIAFCADGTWDGAGANTNVYKIFKAMLQIPGGQIAYYDDGVGADGLPLERLEGGALGQGLFQKIKDGYTHIADVYEAGDEIFLVGFSRGAYTARSLAGMIAICGLPLRPHDSRLVDTAFAGYRSRGQREMLLDSLASYEMYDAQITMVGVWDTVGSLGIPAICGGVDPLIYGFLDTGLHGDVKNAFHAVAIDERRREFSAALWTSAPTAGQTLEQVYFCGSHGDVGGVYANDPATGTALSDLTLSWMMNRANRLGLQLSPEVLARYPSPMEAKYALDSWHTEWNPLWLFPESRTIDGRATLANSVEVRCAEDELYRPRNLSLIGGLPGSSYGTANVVSR